MSIHYRKNSESTYKSLNIPESHINCLELKKRIIEKEKYDNRRGYFTLALFDENKTRGSLLFSFLYSIEYQDDETIPKNRKVVIVVGIASNYESSIIKKIRDMEKRRSRNDPVQSLAQVGDTVNTVASVPAV